MFVHGESKLVEKSKKIMGLVRQTRDGKTSSSVFGERMVGTGPVADQIRSLFSVFRKKFELDKNFPPQTCDLFERPGKTPGQQRLF